MKSYTTPGKGFEASGIEAVHWRDASPVRAIFRQAFKDAGLAYFPRHSFRHTLGQLMQAGSPKSPTLPHSIHGSKNPPDLERAVRVVTVMLTDEHGLTKTAAFEKNDHPHQQKCNPLERGPPERPELIPKNCFIFSMQIA